MNKIRSSIFHTLSRNPWIGRDDIIKLYLDFIEKEYINIIKKGAESLRIPDEIELKRDFFKEKRRRKYLRKPPKNLQRQKIFFNWLRDAKSGKRKVDTTDQDSVQFEWEIIENVSTRSIPHEPERETLDADMYSMQPVKRFDLSNLETDELKEPGKTESDVSRELVLDMSGDKFIKLVNIIKDAAGGTLKDINKYYDKDFGIITEVTLDQDDERALKTWLLIIDKMKAENLDEKVIVKWLKKNKLSDSEIMQKIVDIMLKSGMGPKRSDRFNATEEILEV